LGVRGRVKRRRLVVQRRIAAATVELVAGDREKIQRRRIITNMVSTRTVYRTPIWTSC
jgi:hypothetical protein